MDFEREKQAQLDGLKDAQRRLVKALMKCGAFVEMRAAGGDEIAQTLAAEVSDAHAAMFAENFSATMWLDYVSGKD